MPSSQPCFQLDQKISNSLRPVSCPCPRSSGDMWSGHKGPKPKWAMGVEKCFLRWLYRRGIVSGLLKDEMSGWRQACYPERTSVNQYWKTIFEGGTIQADGCIIIMAGCNCCVGLHCVMCKVCTVLCVWGVKAYIAIQLSIMFQFLIIYNNGVSTVSSKQ